MLLGCLHSLDWTGGLTLTIIFTLLTRPVLTCRVMWSPCSLLSAHTLMEQISRPTALVKVFVARVVITSILKLL